MQTSAPTQQPHQLSPFQEKLCRLRLAGSSYHEISQTLQRAEGTVKNDFMRIHQRLGIRLSCELGAAYMKYELSRHNK